MVSIIWTSIDLSYNSSIINDWGNESKLFLCQQYLYISESLFVVVTFITDFSRIFKYSFMHLLKLGFINVFFLQ